jgi:hypothetical protein
VTVDGRELLVRVSLGASTYPEDGDTFGALLHVADTRMYESQAPRPGADQPTGFGALRATHRPDGAAPPRPRHPSPCRPMTRRALRAGEPLHREDERPQRQQEHATRPSATRASASSAPALRGRSSTSASKPMPSTSVPSTGRR